jgi:hypothetical protein
MISYGCTSARFTHSLLSMSSNLKMEEVHVSETSTEYTIYTTSHPRRYYYRHDNLKYGTEYLMNG